MFPSSVDGGVRLVVLSHRRPSDAYIDSLRVPQACDLF
jgi:hypothetical protein